MTLADLKPYQVFSFADSKDKDELFVVIDKSSSFSDRKIVRNLRSELDYLRRSNEAVRIIRAAFFSKN